MKTALSFLAILSITGCFSKGENPRADKVGQTVVGESLARGKDAVCMDNLSQIRQGIEVAKTADPESGPKSLDDLKFPKSMLMCPIGKEPYVFDAAAGTVKCVHLGHEKY